MLTLFLENSKGVVRVVYYGKRECSHRRHSDSLSLEKFTLRFKLQVTSPRDGSVGAASVGAASLGARRDAPLPKQAPSVRSDERPLATQGDMLNSIKVTYHRVCAK